MKVPSTRFGEQEIEEEKVIRMPEGMLGFPDKRFVLLTPPKPGPFLWFQSAEDPNLAFVVVDAKECVPELTFPLTSDEFQKLELDPERPDLIFLLVVTMAPDPLDITVNLQGPIALNAEKLIAKQIVLDGVNYTTRHPFFAPAARQAAGRDTA
ncbi:flagellar assembly protein FliW [Geomesophilobacter sediminis]|uniref:Flagellar assembly factor FliW n=1 Tax=Geomesophilobacter sediminis TaxID=2798584 RepID=A0A8J7LUM4_9BACT|nr:flagellar assembly protein FliW [Geomesophilobacter sediminis]MBJ6724829.1 flagellar assembly protein FliW [Geomesophilobacter sediminis]